MCQIGDKALAVSQQARLLVSFPTYTTVAESGRMSESAGSGGNRHTAGDVPGIVRGGAACREQTGAVLVPSRLLDFTRASMRTLAVIETLATLARLRRKRPAMCNAA
jgi:hypothetical protein